MPTLTDIALDAMGSDKAPDPEIKGAIHACRHLPVRVHLVGPEDRLRAALHDATGGEQLPIVIVPAAEWITMDEKAATAIRKKPGSSMRVGLRLVKENKAAGFLTAGNTGAAMALAKMVLGAVARGGSSFAGRDAADLDGLALRAARCGRKCRLQAA